MVKGRLIRPPYLNLFYVVKIFLVISVKKDFTHGTVTIVYFEMIMRAGCVRNGPPCGRGSTAILQASFPP